MPIIRNPFRKQDENVRPATAIITSNGDSKPTSSSRSLDLTKEKEPAEYKLSEINDSGVCLPPSPGEERKSFWGHTNSSRSTTTTNSAHRSLIRENEPFNISRESFDSYRRSFDISGRSPMPSMDSTRPPRASLDSRTFLPPPRSSNTFARPPPTPVHPPSTREEPAEEGAFEDVALADPKPTQQPKKRGLFARLTDSNNEHSQATAGAQASGGDSKWHFGGRKRGQSGQGAELGSMPKREENATPKPESGLRRSETPKPVVENSQAPSNEAST